MKLLISQTCDELKDEYFFTTFFLTRYKKAHVILQGLAETVQVVRLNLQAQVHSNIARLRTEWKILEYKN